MTAFDDAADLREAAMGREITVETILEREQKVRSGFWGKLKRVAGHVPFVEDLVAAYYCAMDPATPIRVRGMLLAALAYFIMPIDLIPDIVAGLGFVSANITPVHRAAAARALDKELPDAGAKAHG
jgi:uncharacterized membrane protein YkvA (DUF1232 family)